MINNKKLPNVQLYSDGGANPNPGKGGYGIILCYGDVKKELSEGFEMTTNNRMELTGVITGLTKLKTKSRVKVFTDSQYTINGIEKGWAEKWKKNNWYRTKSEKAVNYDLWEKLLDIVNKHEVQFEWVKGHNGHEENERCDELATLAMENKNLLIDENYIPTKNDKQTKLGLSNNDKNAKEIIEVLSKGKGDSSIKVKNEGDPCKKCLTPVIKKKPKHTKKTLLKSYYYEYYFTCPMCKTNYMVNEAKREIQTLKL